MTALEAVSTEGVRGHINKRRGQKYDALVGQGGEKRIEATRRSGALIPALGFLIPVIFLSLPCFLLHQPLTSKVCKICNNISSDIEYNIHRRTLHSLK